MSLTLLPLLLSSSSSSMGELSINNFCRHVVITPPSGAAAGLHSTGTSVRRGGGRGKHSQSLSVVLGVEADRLDGCHDDHHAEGDGDKQHNDVLGPILQGQLLVLVVLGLHHAGGLGRGGRLPVLLRPAITSCCCCSSSTSAFSPASSGPEPGRCRLLWLSGGFRGCVRLRLVLMRDK